MASARAEERRLHPPRLCQPVAVLEVGFQLCRQLWPDRHQARFVELGVPNGQDTLSEIDVSHREPDTPSPSASTLTQQHELIRSADEYGDLFAHAATAISGGTTPHTTEIAQP